MKLLYLIGPFRGATAWDIEQNVRRAELAALQIWKMGAAALIPHANTRFFQGQLADEAFLAGALTMLVRCDGAVLLPGWEQSEGSRDERSAAARLSMPIFEWPHAARAVQAWLREPPATAATHRRTFAQGPYS